MTNLRRLEAPDEVQVYVTAVDLLRDASAIGPDAVALIRRVMDELRS